jgi:hypothetical protein
MKARKRVVRYSLPLWGIRLPLAGWSCVSFDIS